MTCNTLYLLILPILFLFTSNELKSNNFEVSDIPENLKKNSNSVVRFYNEQIEISEKYEMNVTIEWAITVFNASGNDHINTVAVYSNSTKISEMSGRVFDAFGNEIKKIKKQEIKDVQAISSSSIFIDYRMKYIDFTPVTYPYTFHFKIVTSSTNTAFIPQINVLEYPFQAIQSYSYKLLYPGQWKLKHSDRNFEDKAINHVDEPGNYQVSFENLTAIVPEFGSPSISYLTPYAKFSLNHFSLEGVKGKAENWEEFGNWYHDNMLLDRHELPEETRKKVVDMTKDVESLAERAKIVFEFMQSRTRYIDVTIGIGGWRPMRVADVDRLGYGDCKALSFYTIALLEAAGVPATYTIVYAGNTPLSIDTNQVSVQGNHVIVSVPLADTTIWLETTNQFIPFGYLGNFTDNRLVLSLRERKTQVERTIIYPDSTNKQTTTAEIALDKNGILRADIHIKTQGSQFSSRYHLAKAKSDEQDKFYRNHWSHLESIRFDSIILFVDKENISFKEHIKLTAPAYGTKSGNRIFVAPNAFNRWTSIPPRYPERKFPLQITRGFYDVDEYSITIPEGYSIEALPEDINLSTPFGHYSVQVVYLDNIIKYKRELLLKSGNFSPEKYNEYQQFRRDISRNDQSNIVLIQN
jgi:transglutaminase-like putative cysteine protease